MKTEGLIRHVELKPYTHKVNGFTVPAPEKAAPNKNSKYYVACPRSHSWYMYINWKNDSVGNEYLERGLIYSTKEAAIANAKSMIGIDPYKD